MADESVSLVIAWYPPAFIRLDHLSQSCASEPLAMASEHLLRLSYAVFVMSRTRLGTRLVQAGGIRSSVPTS
jgi:hypothetical protein